MSTDTTTKVKKLPAKKVFADVKAIDSKHLHTDFSKVVRLAPKARLDGLKAKIEGPFAVAQFGEDKYAIGFTVKTTQRDADKAIGALFKARGLEIVKI